MKKKLRRFVRITRYILNSIATSGPLMALTGLGIVFLVIPESSFTHAYDRLFRWADPPIWGAASLILGMLGYLGYFAQDRKLWRMAHGFGFVIFASLSAGFTPELRWPLAEWLATGSSSWTGATTYAALAANAYVRMRGLYREPHWNE